MANCAKCGKSVGCGCNLKGSLCATCANEKANQEAADKAALIKMKDPNDRNKQ